MYHLIILLIHLFVWLLRDKDKGLPRATLGRPGRDSAPFTDDLLTDLLDGQGQSAQARPLAAPARPVRSHPASQRAAVLQPQEVMARSRGRHRGESPVPPFVALTKLLRLNHVRVRRVMHSSHAYHSFTIAKRSGQPRQIDAPCRSLKYVQRSILRRLVEPYDRHAAVHGFRRDRGIASNAAPHIGQELVLSVDLAGFFPTITSRRVYGLLRRLSWPANLASMLTRLVTWQGAPTSPALANLVAWRLDQRLSGLAARRAIHYTRYADDLTFSGSAAAVRAVFPLLRRIVEEEGFKLSDRKTRFMRQGRRQLVTGLVVNRQVSTPRDYRRRIRAALHNISQGRTTFAQPAERERALRELSGHVAYVRSISPAQAAPLESALAAIRGAS